MSNRRRRPAKPVATQVAKPVSAAPATRHRRPDLIGNALRAAENLPEPMNLEQFLFDYSVQNGYHWHLGRAENISARTQMQARLRVALPEDKATFQRAVEAGEFSHLNGTKLCGTDTTKSSNWNRGKATLPRPDYCVVDGMKLPAIVSLVQQAVIAGDTGFIKPNEKGVSEVMDVAAESAKRRDRFVKNKLRDYGIIAIKEAQRKDAVEQMNEAKTALADATTARLEWEAELAVFAQNTRAKFDNLGGMQ